MLFQIFEQNRTLLEERNSYLRPLLPRIISLTDKLEKNACSDYFDAFKRKEFRRGEYLFCEGSICYTIWFLESGLVRLFDQKDGEQVTRYFFCAGELIDDTASSTLKVPSVVNIQAINDSTVYVVRRSIFEKLAQIYPAVGEIEKIALQGFGIWLERRMSRMQHLGIKEQYIYMLKDQAPLIRYLSNKHIASYLGTTAETISRIRKEIGQGKV